MADLLAPKVIEAFLREQPAEAPHLRSDGDHLYVGESLFAEWAENGVAILSLGRESRGPMRMETLTTLVRLEMQKQKVLECLTQSHSMRAPPSADGGAGLTA